MEESQIKRPIVWITGAFVLGEVAAYWSGSAGKSGKTGMLVLSILFLIAGILLTKRKKEEIDSRRFLWKSVLLLLCLAGWGRMSWELGERPVEAYLRMQEQQAESRAFAAEGQAQGILISDTEKNGYHTFTLSDVELTVFGQEGASSPVFRERRLLVSIKSDLLEAAAPVCGSRILVSGTAERMDHARNPGGFDAWLSYRGKKVSVRLRAKTLSTLEAGEKPGQKVAASFRTWGRNALSQICCEEDLGIFQAVLFGDKSELSEETEQLFQKNGIAHILAVSGLHVSLIGLSFYRALRFLGLGYGNAGIASSLLLFFYGSVTGFGASVFRAVGMALIGFLAKWLGRTSDLLSSLALTLLFLTLDSPLLLCSGGLQLSYLAVLAVGLWQEERSGRMRGTGRFAGLAESFGLSLWIQLLTLPVLLYHFFSFPLWGVFLNLLVIPLLSYAAASGMLGLFVFLLFEFLPVGHAMLLNGARMLLGPGHFIFLCYRKLCVLAEQLPFSTIATGRPEFWKILLYYLVLFFLYRNRKQLPLFVGSLALLCTRPIHGLHVWFLDVGQGDCVVVQSKDGTILSDCGSSQEKQVGKWTLSPFLKSQGMKSLDYVLVSHSDADHTNGILWLLEEETDLSIKRLVLPLVGAGDEDYQRLVDAAEKRKIPVFYLAAGETFSMGELIVSCLYPAAPEREGAGLSMDANAQSLVLDVRYQNFSLLLTGDIGTKEEIQVQRQLADQYAEQEKQLTVLKGAHHGSGGSSSLEFLEAVRPQLTVLSYGAGNSYGHPAAEALERLQEVQTEIWETAKTGAIHLETDGKTWSASAFLEEEVQKEEKTGYNK